MKSTEIRACQKSKFEVTKNELDIIRYFPPKRNVLAHFYLMWKLIKYPLLISLRVVLIVKWLTALADLS